MIAPRKPPFSISTRWRPTAWLGLVLAMACGAPASPVAPDSTTAAPSATTPPPSAPTATAAPAESAPPPPAVEERLGKVATRLGALSAEWIGFWKTHGPDKEFGGFHGRVDRRGQPASPTDKGIIQQARHLWTFSTWYARREPKPEVKAIADDLYGFISKHFRDKDGEFFFKVSRDGKKVVEKRKVLYANAFVIYAFSEYARAFGVAEAKERALACFRSLDRRAHDRVNGGYDQRRDPAWLSAGAAKETNTHLHLMEAFTTLYELTRDETVRARLEELLGVFVDRIVQRPGDFAQKEFLQDWKPFGPRIVSYGHDLETAWLMLETARALGRPDDAKVVDAVRRMGLASAEAGFDPGKGGYFEEGVPGGAPNKLEKIWWVQVEAIPALIALHRLTRDPKLVDKLERTLDFIERFQRDEEYGELYWGVLADGSVGPHGDHKGEEWKASYHQVRAAVFGEDMIRGK